MSLTKIRTRLNTLRRKFAIPLAVMRLRRLASDHSCQCAAALAHRRPQPQPHRFITQLSRHGLHLPAMISLHRYLERCQDHQTPPDPHEIARRLFPWADRLLDLLPNPNP